LDLRGPTSKRREGGRGKMKKRNGEGGGRLGRLSLSTDGDKCAMVNFGGTEKSILGGNEKV